MFKLCMTFSALLLGGSAIADQWFVSYSGQNGSLMQIGYGTVSNQPQYAALDLTSSYLRMIYGPASGWGASIITMPSYWSGGAYHQGYPVMESHQTVGNALVVTLHASTGPLAITETITFEPPTTNDFRAKVQANMTGNVQLDNRPGEAFKPVMLSSMHESSTIWDSVNSFVNTTESSFPGGGWIISPNPPVIGTQFGLLGGTSQWKTNAPTTTIAMVNPMQVAGWLNTDTNPNDDNVGFWAASNSLMSSWSYGIIANDAAVPSQFVQPSGFGILTGFLASGVLSDLFFGDEERMIIRSGLTLSATGAPVQIVLNGTSPLTHPSVLKFRLKAEAQMPVSQGIELFDYVANRFVLVDIRTATTSDSVAEVIATNPSRFIDPATGHMQARVSFKTVQPTLSSIWATGIDQAIWEATP